MADQKISELTNITGANLADADEFVVVDVSADQTKAVTRAEFFKNTPPINVTGTVTADGLTVDGTTELNGNTTVNDGWLRVQGATGALYLEDTDVSAQSRIWQTGENLYIDNQSTIGGGTYFRTENGKIRQLIRGNGDISFRNTDGTVDGLLWDASAQALGIGTSSPSSKLHVNSGVYDTIATFESTDRYGTLNLKDSTSTASTGGVTFGVDGDALYFQTGATRTNAMTIDSSRNVGISGVFTVGGPSDNFPSDNATGSGTALNPNGRISTVVSNSAGLNVGRHSGTGAVAQWYYAGPVVGSVSVTASATAYNTSSDYRLKENITPVQGAADIVKAMQPVTYTFKSDGSWHDGFLAHELQELHPRAVIGEKDAMKDEEYEVTPAVYEDIIIPAVEAVAEVPAVYDDEGVLVSEMIPAVEAQPERTEQKLVSEAVMGTRSVPDYQGVDYSKLTPILTAALQEALNKIDALEARLTALEGTV